MRVILCDDNAQDRERFSAMVTAAAAAIHEPLDLQQCQNGNQVLFILEDAGTIDAIFFDINLSGTDGMQMAKSIRENGYQNELVFLTNSETRWRDAFPLYALNYMVKDETTQLQMDWVIREVAQRCHRRGNEYISVTSGGKTHNIHISDIYYFEVTARIVIVHTVGGSVSFYSTMGKIESKLSTQGFVRIHRAFLVAKCYIQNYCFDHVTLQNGEELPISRGNYAAICEALGETAEHKGA